VSLKTWVAVVGSTIGALLAILNIQSSSHRWPIFKRHWRRNRRWRLDHDLLSHRRDHRNSLERLALERVLVADVLADQHGHCSWR